VPCKVGAPKWRKIGFLTRAAHKTRQNLWRRVPGPAGHRSEVIDFTEATLGGVDAHDAPGHDAVSGDVEIFLIWPRGQPCSAASDSSCLTRAARAQCPIAFRPASVIQSRTLSPLRPDVRHGRVGREAVAHKLDQRFGREAPREHYQRSAPLAATGEKFERALARRFGSAAGCPAKRHGFASRPASVIRTRATSIDCGPTAIRSAVAVGSPARGSPAIYAVVKPCARRIASVQPSGPEAASSSSARRRRVGTAQAAAFSFGAMNKSSQFVGMSR
jgi:hypothetical protein